MTKLFESLTLRGLTVRNRIWLAPMCQYSVTDGFIGDYHLVHLGRFALGGFGLVVVEATGVTADGRISHGDVGLWSDEHVPGLARVVEFLHAEGTAAGIQLGHAGAKASSHRPSRSARHDGQYRDPRRRTGPSGRWRSRTATSRRRA